MELRYYKITASKITRKLQARRDRSSLQEVLSEKFVLRIWVRFQKSIREASHILIK